jgi:hypothetical protein
MFILQAQKYGKSLKQAFNGNLTGHKTAKIGTEFKTYAGATKWMFDDWMEICGIFKYEISK